MRRWMLLAVALLLPPAGAAAAGPASFPETPAGRRVAAFFEAFQAGTEERLAAYFSAAVSPDGLKQRPAAERARRLAAIRKEIGDVVVKRIDAPSPGRVVVVTEGKGGELTKWTLEFGPPPDAFLQGIGVDEASPADLEGPAAPMTEDEAVARVEALASEAAASGRFSGVVLLARNGDVRLHRAWGLAHRGLAAPNRPDTKFNLGSINKLFTRVAVAQLLAAGRLSLDDPLGKHLPDYPNADARKATIRQLLDMQSGIGDFFGPEFEAMPKDRLRKNADFLPLFAKKPLHFAPGAGRRYSNGGYVVLGEIVAKASGRDYDDYVRENVYARAGMKETDSFEADVPVPNLAEGYTRPEEGGDLRSNVYTRPARGSAAGGGYSTAPDLLRFTKALFADELLPPAFTEWIAARVEPEPGKPLGDRRRGGLGVAGGAPGISALLEADRETGWTFVVLANLDPPAAESLGKGIRRLLDAVKR